MSFDAMRQHQKKVYLPLAIIVTVTFVFFFGARGGVANLFRSSETLTLEDRLIRLGHDLQSAGMLAPPPSDWYRELGLNYLPAIVFFDERGKEVMRLDSETLRFRMEGSLQLVLERGYERDAQLQRWRRAKAIESIERRSAGSWDVSRRE